MQSEAFAGLYGKSPAGHITVDYYFNVIRTSALLSGVDFPKSLPLLRSLEPSVAEYIDNNVNGARAAGIKLYEPTGQSLKATFCTGFYPEGIEALVGSPCCSACAALLLDKVLKDRAKQPCNASGATPHPKANHAYCERDHLIDKLEKARETIVKLFQEKEHEKRARLTAERRARRLESKLQAGINKGNYPKFIRAFQSAADDGLVPDELLQNILTDIAKSLRGKHKWHKDSKSFYTCLLNCKDPWVVKFVSVNLLGMDIRTVQRDRADRTTEFIAGQVKDNLQQGAKMLIDYGMSGVPVAVTEDATSALSHLDAEQKTSATSGEPEVWIEGFEEPVKVSSIQELEDEFKDRKETGVARSVYVWTLVPQLPNAPYLPVFMVASNNRFNARWVWEWWEYIMQECIDLCINLIGFNSDGDSRLRKTDAQLLLHSLCARMHILTSDGVPHPFMYLSVGSIKGKYCLAGQDYFHVMMRLRRLLLDHKHKLALGRMGLARASQLKECPHLHAGDLRYADKQNWQGVIRIFSKQTKEWLAKRAETDAAVVPTLAYVEFGFRLLRMATGDNVDVNVANLPEAQYNALRKQAVEDAAFCLTFAITWRHWLVNHANKLRKPTHIEGAYKLDTHFITRETFLDVIVMCQSRILMVKLYREEHSAFRIFGDRFSSRFSEYVFQYSRMAETNAPLFSVLGFKRHLRHFHLMVDMAATSGLKMPPSKRGVPNDISRVDVEKYAAPPGWHLTDAEICTILDGQVKKAPGNSDAANVLKQCVEGDTTATGDCNKWWIGMLECPEIDKTNLRKEKEFFSHPVKHFKTGDLWNVGVGDDVPDPEDEVYREDDGDDDVVAIDVIDVDEEQDAAAIFSGVVRRSGQYGDAAVQGAAKSDNFFREVCDKLKKFNSEIIKMAQDRKYRFQVTKLFHSRAKEVEEADKWDYYSEDDDALVVVEHSNTKKFVIGNVLELIVLNEVPSNKRNLTAGNAVRRGKPEQRVPIDFKPDRVVMLMKLYSEADKDGNVLKGYGNANHRLYNLPTHAECAPDYWLSESVLGHVRLKPVDKLRGQVVHRMFKEQAISDRQDLLDMYNQRPG